MSSFLMHSYNIHLLLPSNNLLLYYHLHHQQQLQNAVADFRCALLFLLGPLPNTSIGASDGISAETDGGRAGWQPSTG